MCIAGFLAPSEEVRQKAAELVGRERFFTIHLSAPIEVCRARETEGMYAKADAGELLNFPGVSAPYEVPTSPDLVLPTHAQSIEQCIDQIVELLRAKKVV
jgi:bifunctional enzyme CysN/CysC